ncbi:TetR/AcrR family transcriptional regulator [Prevotella dentasini]|uniref:TetR/AcrR family transcriptional regulator n=1 Tax=Prevotella dentasini TaxID=589537 RepID=UPI0004681CD9|nr:TetR/AcrR family transcriptional regulator [Prevotella dentasini]
MQTQKDEIRRLLLLVARDEFLKNGVKRTSMKTIADKSGVAVGNIYNYYKGKDDLLKAVLAPLFKVCRDYRAMNLDVTYTTLDLFRYEVYYEIMRQQVASFVKPYRKELRLLIFETAGTSLEGCFSQWLEGFFQDGQRYIARMKQLHPSITADVSPHFVRILCELWSGLIKTIVVNEEISEDGLNKIISNYVRFGIGGWKSLMGVE